MERRQSIAETAKDAIEARLGGIGVRLNGTMRRTASNTTVPTEGFSMNPEDYELKQVIGQGSSATVYLANYKLQNLPVSIKVIDLDLFERNQIDELRRELQIMTLSKHTNLLPVYGSFVNGSKLFIVTPFLSAGSGLDIMKTAYKNGMEEAVIATILKQVLQGLEYLHAQGLIHRDIKAGNLLVNNDGLVQLADFGVSSSLSENGNRNASRKTFVGTPCWMAPEVMDQSGYDFKADIWSFGITALELANGHAPYAKFPPMKVLMLTLQNSPPTLDREKTFHKYSKSFKDMIDSCLQKDPAKRPTAEKLLTHPFFKTAKKPQYLVGTLLKELTPITERQHRTQSQLNLEELTAEKTGDEWDFDDKSAGEKSLPYPEKKDQSGETIIRESLTNDPSNTDSMDRRKTVSFGDMKESAEHKGSQDSTLPRKSRFVVDNPNAPATKPEPQPEAPPPAEVKKGRFSVNSQASMTNVGANANSVTGTTGSNANVGSNANSVTGTTGSNQVLPNLPLTQTLTGSSETNMSEGYNSLERKAGRFAFQNLPPSAKTSPVIPATEGPKVPRKFTVITDNPISMSPNQATVSSIASTDKKSRFKVIDATPQELLAQAHPLLTQTTQPIPDDLSDSEKIAKLKQRVEVQAQIIQDFVNLLNKNGLLPMQRSNSADSEI
ncbi:hypothetical protein HDV06_006921 [Boothiomyces sp. JEL0866]|nr:hypothetical protein HDV06_006921 [Boothiomyces sp. JEL0866]